MSERENDPQIPRSALANRLAAATGVTHPEAEELLTKIGTKWSSLLREAERLQRYRRLGIAAYWC